MIMKKIVRNKKVSRNDTKHTKTDKKEQQKESNGSLYSNVF